jgi:hypothetical protein
MKAKLDEVQAQVQKIRNMSETELDEFAAGAHQQELADQMQWEARLLGYREGTTLNPQSSWVDDISYYRWYLVKCRKALLDAMTDRAHELWKLAGSDPYAVPKNYSLLANDVQEWSDWLGEWMHDQSGWTGYIDYLDNHGTRFFEFFDQINPAPVAEVPESSRGGTAVADRAGSSPATYKLVEASFSEAAPEAAVAQAGNPTPTPSTLTPQQLKQLMNNVQNMTPDQLQQAATRAAQQVASTNIAQSVSNLPPVTADTLNTVVTITVKNTNSPTPMAPPSLSSLLPVADVINKITTASNSTTLSPEAKNMQIAMAAIEGAAALDPTGIVGIVSAYTKPLCSLVTQGTANNGNSGVQPAAEQQSMGGPGPVQPNPIPQAYTKFMNVSAGYISLLSSITNASSKQTAQQVQTVMAQYNQALAQLQGVSLTSDQQAAVASQQQQVSAQVARVRSLPGGVQATSKKLPGDD